MDQLDELGTMQEIVELYESHPDYKLENKEFINNLQYTTSALSRGMNEIINTIGDLRAINELNRLNYKDLTDKRITTDQYVERTEQDVIRTEKIAIDVQERFKQLRPALKLLQELSDKIAQGQVEFDQEIKCKWDCDICIDEISTYCLTKCSRCSKLDKTPDDEKKISISTKETVNNESVEKSQPVASTGQLRLLIQPVSVTKENLIAGNDKYFDVTLTSSTDDGSKDYVILSLEKNFKQMFPSSYKARAWVYSIEITTDGVPQLNGLIRYDENNKHRITPKSSHIKNVISSEYTGERNSRRCRVESLTQYQNKRYNTKTDRVIERYIYITKDGTAVGDNLEKFL